MKMKIELTADELMDVVDAVMDEAIARGYDPVEDEETAEDMLHIVDAALSAMGIEIFDEDEEEDDDDFEDYDDDDEDDEFDDEEEENYDPIEELLVVINGKRFLKESDANMIIGFMHEVVEERAGELPNEAKAQIMFEMWCAMGDELNITGVLKGE